MDTYPGEEGEGDEEHEVEYNVDQEQGVADQLRLVAGATQAGLEVPSLRARTAGKALVAIRTPSPPCASVLK